MRFRWLSFAALLLAVSTSASAPARPTDAAETYFAHALKLLKDKHINSGKADWISLETRAWQELGDAQTSADTYKAIRFLLRELGEKHSFLLEPRPPFNGDPQDKTSQGKGQAPSLPTARLIEKRFGLVSLPALDTIGAGREAAGPVYSKELSGALQRMDAEGLCGWIVDLRDNGGGNMWPMLQGLDPLLGEPPFGFFLAQRGNLLPWVRTPGGIFPHPGQMGPVEPAFALKRSGAPLAVLVGPKTSSSGEMVAIAFAGRAGVKSFGQPTAGYATGNAVHPLGDGAFLAITEVTVRDRQGRDYGGPITPDEQVAPDRTETAAVRWLKSQCAR